MTSAGPATDVIVAAATPWGRGALAIVRLSGGGLDRVLRRFVRPRSGWPVPAGRQRRVDVVDGDEVLDDGVLVVGKAPRTATGEPTAELTVHGNPWVVERVLDAAVAAGARLARPGEFTRRAVLHGKMDLVQAEGVLQVSAAATRSGSRAGRAALEGRLSGAYEEIRQELLIVAAELEARLDQGHDELAIEDDAALFGRLDQVAGRARALAATHARGRVLVHGARVALVGPVNAGKSSLFNALVGSRRALVHDRPGTTRDVLEVQTVLDGLPVVLLDTAGERVTADPVEAAGLALAQELTAEADALLVVLRARAGGPDAVEQALLDRTSGRPRVVVYNGVDEADVAPPPPGAVTTVATTGQGIAGIPGALRRVLLGDGPVEAELLVASARQRDLLAAVAAHAEEAMAALEPAGPAVASELALAALEELDALTGTDSREAVLDALFARFCIGK